MRFRQAVYAFVLFSWSLHLGAQGSTGTQVYAKTHGAVFLIYLTDAEGKSVALGSGFLVAPHTIATNAHVANAGKPVIAVGDIRIPAKVIRVDTEHDLALLNVDVDITSDPLVLSSAKIEVGEDVYAIGSPEGLENTFSQGIISADRTSEKDSLIQITNPISHGSSGGPIVDHNGQVVGVAVAFLGEGQNLNFAVPVRYLDELLHSSSSAIATSDQAKSSLEKAEAIRKDRENDEFSEDPSSPWQVKNKQIDALLGVAAGSSDTSVLIELAESWDASPSQNDISLQAAEKAYRAQDTITTAEALVDALTYNAIFLDSKSPSYQETLTRAASIGGEWTLRGKSTNSTILSGLAYVRELQDQPNEAIQLYVRALTAPSDDWTPAKEVILRGLIRNSQSIKDVPQRHRWFAQLVQTGNANSDDLGDEASRLLDEGDLAESASLYEQSAKQSKTGFEWCVASVERGTLGAKDETLSDGRECLSRQIAIQRDSKDPMDNTFSDVNMYMARVLNTRGVYTEALNHASEATKLNPQNGEAYDDMADSLYDLQRYQECVSAENEAIRLSDGKYSFMHFRLGTAYFALEQWKSAETEFETAANMDPKDDASAYNLALSLQRQGINMDAARWMQEVLRRNPNRQDRADILQMIHDLRQ